ncbi:MAG: polyprenol monophosphomannose synthase [Phycisphaerales bacterium]|nr:polyprenol monophosphomannose synthase [Phycisphaerales bacterium]
MSAVVPPISIIVPTYREAANVAPLAERVFCALAAAGIGGELIIVDDQSDDGTPDIVRQLAVDRPIRLVQRTGPRGLALAVIDGFAAARHDVFVVMDADLQHPPEGIPELLRPIFDGRADMVFGSRHAPGGQIDDRWSLNRRVTSRLATLLTRPLLPTVTDPLSGFFALRRSVWLNAAGLQPRGYKIGLELAVRCRGARISEVPITFACRRAGRSKLGVAAKLAFVRQLIHLYAHRKEM